MKKRFIPEVRPKTEKILRVWVKYALPDTFESLQELATCFLEFAKDLGYKLKKGEKEFITNHINNILEIWHKRIKKYIQIIKDSNDDKE